LNGIERRTYLERDTVDQQYHYGPSGQYFEYYRTVIRRETGDTQTFDFGLVADQGASGKYEWPASFSPDGRYALVPMEADYPCLNDGGYNKYEIYLFEVTPGATSDPQPQLNPLLTACQSAPGPYPSGTAWAAVSDRFLLALLEQAPSPAYFNSVMRSATTTASTWTYSPDVTFAAAYLSGNGTLTPAGDELYWSELDLTAQSVECWDVVRFAAWPYREVSRSFLARSGYNFSQPLGRCFPETLNPAPNAAAAAGDPAPGQWLRDARRHARGPVRVQGN
jgi:hypothetical protein